MGLHGCIKDTTYLVASWRQYNLFGAQPVFCPRESFCHRPITSYSMNAGTTLVLLIIQTCWDLVDFCLVLDVLLVYLQTN